MRLQKSLLAGFLAFSLVIGLPHIARSQTRAETIRGKVTTDSGLVVSGATVFVTMAPDRVVFQSTSDSAGFYTIDIAEGTGDYLVYIAAPGRTAFRKRVLRTGPATYVVDARLTGATQQLAAVRVQTSRPRPTRGEFGTGVGNAERLVDGVAGAINIDALGDLNAATLTTPGVVPIEGGLSVFGLPSSQNSVTVGGMAFPGAELPRDARVTTRVSSSAFDPARGWFSGAQTNADLLMGSLFRSTRAHVTVDAPVFQSGASPALRTGQRYSGIQAAIGGDGPFTYETQNFFNYSAQFKRRVSENSSALTSSDELFNRLGFAPDSVRQALAILGRNGVTALSPLHGLQVNDAASIIARIDHAPVNRNTLAPAKTTYGVMVYGRWAQSKGLSISPTATPGVGGTSNSLAGTVQGVYSRFLTNDYLNETRSSLSYSRSEAEPYLALPTGRVTIQPSANADEGIHELTFGGNSALSSDVSQWTWETINETKFYAKGFQAHRLKLTLDSRIDGARQLSRGDALGTFSFATLGDLAANRPYQFSRTMNDGTPRSASEWNGFIAASDLWRVTPELQVMYGARLEANRFLSVPNRGGQSFESHTSSFAPNRVDLSPRLGFLWYFRPPTSVTRNNTIGSISIGPKAYVRGGIGAFRTMIPVTLLSSGSLASITNGVTQLRCVGDAVPTPDWAAYAAGTSAIPSTCAEAAASHQDRAPSLRFIDQNYKAPKSWRANLGLGSTIPGFTYSVEGTYSLNLNQPDVTNANFKGSSVFTLDNEGRPVFVQPSAIVAGSGAVTARDARRQQDVGSVLIDATTARSTARQLIMTITPNTPAKIYLSTSYTLGSVRSEGQGFLGSTFQSPTESFSSRGDYDVRHRFVTTFGFTGKGVTLSGQAHAMSGFPFTPMVSGDVNGDGFANDRAFIFDPASLSSSTFRSDLTRLLDQGPSPARECLAKQRGRAAERNSCEGPWTALLNAQLSYANKALRARRVSSINLSMTNVLAGVDELLHGANRLHMWGTSGIPDRTLYTVQGFDRATNRFQYAVNRGFGSRSTSATAMRSPFRLTLDVAFTLGRSTAEQQLEQWLQPGRAGRAGPRLTPTDLKKRYERNVPDPYALVVQEADSLLLSRSQVDTLTALRAPYRLRLDSLWVEVSEHMAALEDRYDVAAALKYQEAAFDKAWEISRLEAREHFPKILSRIQLNLLPGWAYTMYHAKEPMTGRRTYMFGAP
jgi:hypothetical protein